MTLPAKTMTDEAPQRIHNAAAARVALPADPPAMPTSEVWQWYEAGKRLIAEQGLSGAEYEAAVRAWAERLGV